MYTIHTSHSTSYPRHTRTATRSHTTPRAAQCQRRCPRVSAGPATSWGTHTSPKGRRLSVIHTSLRHVNYLHRGCPPPHSPSHPTHPTHPPPVFRLFLGREQRSRSKQARRRAARGSGGEREEGCGRIARQSRARRRCSEIPALQSSIPAARGQPGPGPRAQPHLHPNPSACSFLGCSAQLWAPGSPLLQGEERGGTHDGAAGRAGLPEPCKAAAHPSAHRQPRCSPNSAELRVAIEMRDPGAKSRQ